MEKAQFRDMKELQAENARLRKLVRTRLGELSKEHPEHGYRTITGLLRQEGVAPQFA